MFDGYIRYLEVERNASAYTVRNYTNDLLGNYQRGSEKGFFQFLRLKKISSLLEVDKHTLRDYISWLMQQGVVKASIARKLSAIRSLYRYLVREGVLPTNPLEEAATPKLDRRLPSFLTIAEKENNGETLDEERRSKMDNYNFDGFRSGNFVRWARFGVYALTAFGRGPLEYIVRVHEAQQSIVKRADIPSMNTTWPWYYAYDRGYWWVDERDLYGDQIDYARTILPLVVEVIRSTPKNPSGYWTPNEPHGAWFGSQIGPNFNVMLRNMKQVFDPKDIMNPDCLVFVRPKEKKPEGEK